MATRELTQGDFEQTLTSNDIVLVDFWAAWCGPCRQFAPVYDAASEQHPEIVFGKVDTEAEQQLAGAAGITSIPTLMAFREGLLVFSQPGALPAAALEQVIEGVKGLDMESVRDQAATQRALLEKPVLVSQEDFVAVLADGASILDVREPGEYRAGHVPGAVLMPLRTVPDQAGDLDRGAPVYVICETDNRSRTATDFLRRAGIEAYAVRGGTSAWRAAGRPVVTGPYPMGTPA